ncbi:serine/arginine repetitive matrix protein 2-like [Panicum miliaceum]|uniref:Serine/arginine repetitive matrix protein 2-like n=1 Tax=Panicum miliaceum TaxID=4540 RepID=A0A3L6QKE8_PANMI|nr:serine/arginine repetitive matrix protein 2-like [Panicum miliaceum]
MKLFMCFGGAAAVADDEVAACRRDQRGRQSLSFRGKFLSGNKGSKKKSPPAESKKRGMYADDVVYGVFGPSTASSVASSALLSSAASLDSGYSSSSSSSSRSSTASSSASVSGVLFPPAAKRQQAKKGSSPAAGAAAVVLCLLMVVFCGRVGATLLTSTALYLFPRRWPARTAHGKDGVDSLESDAEEETTARRKVVMDQGFLMRNRKK